MYFFVHPIVKEIERESSRNERQINQCLEDAERILSFVRS
jgi:hypothetical protein